MSFLHGYIKFSSNRLLEKEANLTLLYIILFPFCILWTWKAYIDVGNRYIGSSTYEVAGHLAYYHCGKNAFTLSLAEANGFNSYLIPNGGRVGCKDMKNIFSQHYAKDIKIKYERRIMENSSEDIGVEVRDDTGETIWKIDNELYAWKTRDLSKDSFTRFCLYTYPAIVFYLTLADVVLYLITCRTRGGDKAGH